MIHEDRTLFLHFRLALEQPVDPTVTPLHYKVYDPTDFIENLHRRPHGARILGPGGLAAPGCRVKLTQPRPDPAMVARSMALDYGATAEHDLGRHFAEQVRVRCDE